MSFEIIKLLFLKMLYTTVLINRICITVLAYWHLTSVIEFVEYVYMDTK